jgi:hypothetical protein
MSVMDIVETLIARARPFPWADRQRVIEAVEDSLDEETTITSGTAEGSYERLLALVGAMHTDFTDVSTDKYKHLAAVYASQTDET